MAEASVAKYDEDLVSCSLCLDIYEDPRTLPCLHSYCFSCLNNLVAKSDHGSKDNFVKCPLCKEEHYIGNKGAAAFRQDFRIKSLIEKMGIKDQLSKPHVSKDLNYTDKCPNHCGQDVRYYCKRETCESVICEACWTESHQDHTVVLLSQHLAPMKQKIGKKIQKHGQKLQDQIKDVLLARDVTEKKNNETLSIINQAVEKLTKPLERLKAVQAGIVSHDNLQQKMIADELDELATLQEQIDELEKTAKHSVTLRQFKDVESELTELAEDIDNWSFYYTCPKVIVKLPRFDDIVQEKCIPFVLGNGENNDKNSDRSKTNSGESDGNEEDDTPNKHVDSNAQQVNVPKNKIFRATLARTWQLHDCQTLDQITTSFSLPNLYIADEKFVYKYTMDGECHGPFITDQIMNNPATNGLSLATIGAQNRGRMLRYNTETMEIIVFPGFTPDEQISEFSVCENIPSARPLGLCCAEDLLAFSYQSEGMVNASVFNLNHIPPNECFRLRDTKLSKTRAMSLLKDKDHCILAFTGYWSVRADNVSPAVHAFDFESEKSWDIHWKTLDKKATKFDLRSITNDGVKFYVANMQTGIVHIISKEGIVLQELLSRLDGTDHPTHMSFHHLTKQLVIVSNFKTVQVFDLHEQKALLKF